MPTTPTQRLIACAFTFAVLATAPTFAGDATWNQLSGTHDWDTAANWLPSDTFPNGAGEVANLNIDITGSVQSVINQDITVGTLNWGDANGAQNWQIGGGGVAGTHTLIFESTTPGGDTFLNVTAVGTSTNVFLSTLNKVMLGGTSNLLWTAGVSGAASHVLNTNTVFDTNGNNVTITGAANQRTAWNVFGDLQGDGTITYSGAGGINVVGTKSFAGTFVINGSRSSGGLDFGGLSIGTRTNVAGLNPSGAIPDAAEIIINGHIISNTIPANRQSGGVVVVGDGVGVLTANPGQRLTQNLITFNGGSLDHRGALSDGSWSDAVQDTVAVMNFNCGYNQVSAERVGVTTAGTYLNATTVQRGDGASLFARADNWAGTRRFIIGNANDFLIGAGGADDTTTKSIIPWIGVSNTYNPSNAAAQNPEGFTTHTANGIRSLALATEYSTDLTAGASHNVNTNSFAGMGGVDRTINALRFTANNQQNIGEGLTLTVASGGVFFALTTVTLASSIHQRTKLLTPARSTSARPKASSGPSSASSTRSARRSPAPAA
ncbi:MAG: hypothetical protein WD042_17030 [Phycisphaeraceae bacterium]